MKSILFLTSIFLVSIGHFYRVKRFGIIINEKIIPKRDVYNSLAIGYITNVILPIRLGELVRAIVISGVNLKKFSTALSAIVIERIIDGMFIVIVIPILYIFSQENNTLLKNLVLPYLIIILIFFLALGLLVSAPNLIKTILLAIFGRFPASVNIHFYRLIFETVNNLKMLLQIKTIIKLLSFSLTMWIFYFLAYICFTASLNQGNVDGLLALLNYLFTFTFVDKAHKDIFSGIALSIFLLIPPFAILIFSQIKYSSSSKSRLDKFKENQVDGLIFANVEIEHHFYISYFKSKNREFYLNYKEIFKHCEILSDESGASGAVTSIVRNDSGKFYRKYAFGENIESLRNQLNFLQTTSHNNFVKIESFKATESIVSFDMKYKDNCIPLSEACQYIEDNLLFGILENIFTNLSLQCVNTNNIYKDTSDYVINKIFKNIELSYEYYRNIHIDVTAPILINGVKYPPVRELLTFFQNLDFRGIFANDTKVQFHGDLTLENIIWDPDSQSNYYFIDPNLTSKFNSLECEIGKLYQSLKFNYEYHKSSKYAELSKNSILFISYYSDKYSKMKSHLDGTLIRSLSKSSLISVRLHAIVHLLRVLPYIKNDKIKKEFILMQIIIGIQDLSFSY